MALLLKGNVAGAIGTEFTGMTSKHGRPSMTTLAEVQGVDRALICFAVRRHQSTLHAST